MKIFLRLVRLYRPYAGWIGLSLLISLVASIANIALMAVSGWFITAMAAAGLAGVSMNYFTPASLIRALAIVRTGGRYLDRLVSHDATLRLTSAIRADLFASLVPLAPGGLEDLRSGDLLARLKGDIDRVELVFLRFLTPLAVAIAVLAFVAVVLFLFDGSLAWPVVTVLAVGGLLLPALVAWLGRSGGMPLAEQSADLKRRLADDLSGLASLTVTGAVDAHRERLAEGYDRVIAEERREARRAAFGQMTGGLSGDVAMGVALVCGLPLLDGALAGPDYAMAALLSLSAAEAFVGMPAAFSALSATVASARRLFAIGDRVPPVTSPTEPLPLPSGNDLVFEDVSLTYAEAGRPALSGINLSLAAGTKVALVGPSGAGKSSLMALMVRLRDPSSGRITLGGVDLDRLPLDGLRARFAVVPQKPHLFTDTIAGNLRLVRPEASEGDLRTALDRAGLGPFVAGLPEGLATKVGVAGTALSGGEARRLAVARALLSDAPILILDEPGEGLDAATEAAMLDAILDHVGGRTVILLTHAKAALARMDEVLTVEAGRIVTRRRSGALSTGADG